MLEKNLKRYKERKTTYGDELRRRRETKGLRQADVAILCGMSRQSLSAVENSKKHLTLEEAMNLAYVLNLDLEELAYLVIRDSAVESE